MATQTKATPKGWSLREKLLLTQAWVVICEHAERINTQSIDHFLLCIIERFFEQVGLVDEYRTKRQMNSKFR